MKRRATASGIDFSAIDWTKVKEGGAVGRMKRKVTGDGETIRILELDPRWNEAEWCEKKHVGYVLSGTLRLKMAEGPPLEVPKGQGFSIPSGCAHKASCRNTTRLFIIG